MAAPMLAGTPRRSRREVASPTTIVNGTRDDWSTL